MCAMDYAAKLKIDIKVDKHDAFSLFSAITRKLTYTKLVAYTPLFETESQH